MAMAGRQSQGYVSPALIAFVEGQGNSVLARLLRARPKYGAHKRLHERYRTETDFAASVDGDLELIRHAERHGAR